MKLEDTAKLLKPKFLENSSESLKKSLDAFVKCCNPDMAEAVALKMGYD